MLFIGQRLLWIRVFVEEPTGASNFTFDFSTKKIQGVAWFSAVDEFSAKDWGYIFANFNDFKSLDKQQRKRIWRYLKWNQKHIMTL